ncbi:MAG: hypothetical protein J6B67_05710 [Oscillospiraceae bacterium]|nr:hypothetical protein [Oscillospiraceae bacterium]
MNDHKKQIRLFGLACLVICGVFLLTGCFGSGEKPTEPTGTTVETTTEPEETTEPETTQPENQETTEDATEATTEEPTEVPNKPSTNTGNGTGGSYKPQVTEPAEEETEPETTEPEVTAPAPGLQENPYYEYIPGAGSFTTVKIPAQGMCSYIVRTSGAFLRVLSAETAVVYDGKTYEPENGGVELKLPASGTASLALQFINNGTQEQAFSVEILEKEGAQSNPIVLTDISSVQVKLTQENKDGVYYAWTADRSGILTVALSSVQPADAKADIAVTVGDKTYKLSESAQGILQIPVSQQDLLIMQLTAQADTGAELTVAGSIGAATAVAYPGFEARIPANSAGYYEGYNLSGTIFCLNAENVAVIHNGVTYLPRQGQIVFPVMAEDRMPARFTIENRGAEDAVYAVSLQYPVGNPMNPAQMALGGSYIQQSAGAEPFCFRYDAVKTGELVLTFDAEAQWCYTVDNLTQQIYGEEQFSDSGESAHVAKIAVQAGDVIQLRVNTYDPQQPWDAPAGRVDFTATLITGPVAVTDLSKPYETTLLAGETVRFKGALQGMMLTIENAQHATLCYNGGYYEAGEDGVLSVTFLEPNAMGELEFTLLNRDVANWNCAMKLTAVAGGPKAPGELVLGSSSVESGEGASGYWFCYTAPKTGELVLSFDPEKTWSYAVNGGPVCYSDAQPQISELAVAVNSADKVLIWVNTYDPENPETTPAGTVSFSARLISAPVELDLAQCDAVELLAQETAQFTGDLRNVILTFMNAENLTLTYNDNVYTAEDGILRVTFPEPDSDGLWKFTLTNSGAEDIRCPVQVSGTEGSRYNPQEMVLGTNTASQAEGAEDRYFCYTAPKAGKLMVSLDAASNWCYSINGGEKQYSGSQSAAEPVEITLTEGEQVILAVNTYDPAAPDTVPAGEVTFRAWLITDTVTVSDPRQPFTAELLVGETARYAGNFKDAVVTVTDAENITAYYGEDIYTADETGSITFAFHDGLWTFSLENNADEDISCAVTFTGEPGTWLNPAGMPLGANTVTRQEGQDPYYWNYHVSKSGELVLTFTTPASWSYSVNGAESHSGVAAMGDTLLITAENGDDIAILINTYDPEAPETAPAGTAAFTATLLTGPVAVTDLEQPMLLQMLAGETVKLTGSFGGEKLTIENAENVTVSCAGADYTADENGVVTLTVSQVEEGALAELTVHNGADLDASYILIFGEEKGTQANPATLIVGSNTAVCKAGSEGYYFTFKAEKDCQIRLTFDQNAQWAFEWAYGSGNSDKASSNWKFRSGKIGAGETVTVLIKTYDPENPGVLPEGTVTFTMDIPVYY